MNMASTLGRAPNHGFSTLLLNRPAPTMPPAIVDRNLLPANIIEISDDEDDLYHNPCRNLTRPDPAAQNIPLLGSSPPLASTMNIRLKPDTLPIARRDSKRQKLHDLPEASGSRPQYPRAKLEFANTDDGPVAYPTFLDDTFVPDYNHMSSGSNPDAARFILQEAAASQDRQPPYYFDSKLNIRMYRGPGHQVFPLPVEHDPSFQDACDAFDAREWEEPVETVYNDVPITAVQQNCLAKILDVFPDIQHEFVLEKIRSQHELIQFPDEEIEMHPDSGALIHEILEMDGYPKQVDSEEPRCKFEGRLGKLIVWTRDHYQNPNYKKDVTALLASHFDHVPTHFINATVLEKGNLFDAYLLIEDIESNYFQGNRPYNRSRRPRVQLEKKYQSQDPQLDPPYYCCLIVELQAGKQQFFRNKLESDHKQEIADAETANLEQHRLDGLLVECKCCFDEEVPMNRIVVCTANEEHPFCYDCVKRFAENQVGMKKYQMQCMDESNCSHNLDNDGIGKAIPIKTFDRLQFNQQQAEIKAANIEGLEQCPLCDFQAICDPPEIGSIFSCQNPDCFKVTCRLCHEISHLPKTCEEVIKDRGISARHRIEEARTRAMIRTCPSCQSAIIKSDGCNKMRCTCGSIICYACKSDLSKLRDAYQHFHQGLTTTTKCPLYDDKMIDRHVQETNEAEEQAIQEAKAEDNTIEESTLRIETGKGKAVDRLGQGDAAQGGLDAVQDYLNEYYNDPHNNLGVSAYFQRRVRERMINDRMIDEAARGGAYLNRHDPRNHRNMHWFDGLRARLPLGPPVIPGFAPPQAGAQPAEPGGLNVPMVPELNDWNQNNQNPFDNPFGNVGREYGYFQRLPPPNFEPGNFQNQNQNYDLHHDAGFGDFGQIPRPINPAIIDGNYMNTAQRIHEARDQMERRRRVQVERRNTVHNPVPLEVGNPNVLPVHSNNTFTPRPVQAQAHSINNGLQRIQSYPHQARPAPAVDVTMANTAQNNGDANGDNITFRNFLQARKELNDLNQRPPVNLPQDQPQSATGNRAPQPLLGNRQAHNQAQPSTHNSTAVFGLYRNQAVPQLLNQLPNQPQPSIQVAQNPRRRRNQSRTQAWITGQTRAPPVQPGAQRLENHRNTGEPDPAQPVRRQTMPLDHINNENGNRFGHKFGDHDFRW